MSKYTVTNQYLKPLSPKEKQKQIQKDLNEGQRETRSDIRIDEIRIPERLATYTDEKRGVKSVAFPFQLPDGINGIITITRLKTGEWLPHTDIEKITLHLKKK